MSTIPAEKTSETTLAPGLKPRHISMISIAGVIGAGLFVGSANAIATAGPAVLLAYAFAGLLVVLVMFAPHGLVGLWERSKGKRGGRDA